MSTPSRWEFFATPEEFEEARRSVTALLQHLANADREVSTLKMFAMTMNERMVKALETETGLPKENALTLSKRAEAAEALFQKEAARNRELQRKYDVMRLWDEECWTCDGKGTDYGETCMTCGGSGNITRERLEATIEAPLKAERDAAIKRAEDAETKLNAVENILIQNRRDYGDPAKELNALFEENGRWQDECLKQTIGLSEAIKQRDEARAAFVWHPISTSPKGSPANEVTSEWFLARGPKVSGAVVIRRVFGVGFGPWEGKGEEYWRADMFTEWMPIPGYEPDYRTDSLKEALSPQPPRAQKVEHGLACAPDHGMPCKVMTPTPAGEGEK